MSELTGFCRCGRLGLVLLVVLWAFSGEGVAGQEEESASKLTISVTPVDASTEEDQAATATRKSKLESWKDLAFAVRITNISDQPVSLLNTRYGDSYGDSSGKSNADWYSQFLFTLNFHDEDGQPIASPATTVVDVDMVLDGAQVADLQPGETLHTLIRPAAWQAALRSRLHAGRYTARISYHGLTSAAADRIRQTRPERQALKSWSGTITSDPVEFELLQGSTQPLLSWGPASNGLQSAMELDIEGQKCFFGNKYDVLFHVRNVSEKDISFSSFLWLSELKMSAFDMQDKEANLSSAWYSGWTLTSRVLLKPGAVVTFNAGNLAIARDKAQKESFEHVTHRSLVGPAGKYKLQLDGRFGNRNGGLRDGQGNVLAPLPGDFEGELVTGPLTIVVAEPVAAGPRRDIVMQTEVDCTFRRTPLQAALQNLCRAAQIELRIEGQELKRLGHTKNLAVTLDLGRTTFEKAVTQIVRDLPGTRFELLESDSGDGHTLLITGGSESVAEGN